MEHTTDRAELIAQLLAPYTVIPRITHRDDVTVAWALITGTAQTIADALLANAGSDYWRNRNPIEDGGDGAAIRWLRESLAGDSKAEERFAAFATVPGCEAPRTTARITRWMIESGFDVYEAIAYTSSDGDEPINADFAPHVRERLIRALPAPEHAAARRQLHNDWKD